MRWFISDNHFGHINILKYQKNTRKFSCVQDMDAFMITAWNARVKVNDTVYVVGDFTFCRKWDELKNLCDSLNGNKILIRGNHDKFNTREYIDAGFVDVRDELLVKLSDRSSVLLKHYPYEVNPFRMLWLKLTKQLGVFKKYYTFYPIDKGFIHIHGHHHGGAVLHGRQINVNVDSNNFKPWSESEIINLIRRVNVTKR